jgi:hypothetical protein
VAGLIIKLIESSRKLKTTRQNNPRLEQKGEVNIIRSTVRQDIEPVVNRLVDSRMRKDGALLVRLQAGSFRLRRDRRRGRDRDRGRQTAE